MLAAVLRFRGEKPHVTSKTQGVGEDTYVRLEVQLCLTKTCSAYCVQVFTEIFFLRAHLKFLRICGMAKRWLPCTVQVDVFGITLNRNLYVSPVLASALLSVHPDGHVVVLSLWSFSTTSRGHKTHT